MGVENERTCGGGWGAVPETGTWEDIEGVVGVPTLEEGLPPMGCMDGFGGVIAGIDERREAEPSDAVFVGVIDAAENSRIDLSRRASRSKPAAVNDGRSCSTQV